MCTCHSIPIPFLFDILEYQLSLVKSLICIDFIILIPLSLSLSKNDEHLTQLESEIRLVQEAALDAVDTDSNAGTSVQNEGSILGKLNSNKIDKQLIYQEKKTSMFYKFYSTVGQCILPGHVRDY